MARYPSPDAFVSLLLAVGLLLLSFYPRIFGLTVQDRVIRLEMELRLRQLLPADLESRIVDLAPRQLVALRFAGDEELPGLCRTVLNDRVTDLTAIKKMIKKWRPDHLRA